MSDTPYYLPIGDEVEIFGAAYACRLPVLLKGPTRCSKTRFVEHMAHRVRGAGPNGVPPGQEAVPDNSSRLRAMKI